MPASLSWPVVLLFVFTTHLPYFAWRWRATGEKRYAATTLTFALLVATYGLRVLAPDLRLGDVPLHAAIRVIALAAAAVSITLFVRHQIAKRLGR
jgi:hypothetical protein